MAERLSPEEYADVASRASIPGFYSINDDDIRPGDMIRLPLSRKMYYMISVIELIEIDRLQITFLAQGRINTVKVYKDNAHLCERLELRETSDA